MTIEIVNHTDQPCAISNFSKTRYVDHAFMEREWTHVWRNSWLVAGLLADVAEPGDYFVFDLGREQILVTRTATGKLAAFYNVCQHRGNRLVHECRGNATHFRCAYHAWTYDTAGTLTNIPYAERFAEPVDTADRALAPVHVDEWAGMVFVHLGASPPPLKDYLGGVVEHLTPYAFERMTLMEDQTVHLACNWKAVVDNFSELYHVDFLHPQHRRMVDCCNDTVHLFAHGHTGLAVPGATFNPRFPEPQAPTDIHRAQLAALGLDPAAFNGRVRDIRRAVQQRKRDAGRSMGFDYDAFDDAQLSDVWQYNLFPNVVLSFTPGHLWLMRARPHPEDPGRCEFDKLSLVMHADPALASRESNAGRGRDHISMPGARPADYTRPERDVFDYQAVVAGEKTMTDTIDQDVSLLAHVQAGMRSAGFTDTCLNDDEMRVQHFHNALDTCLAGDRP